MTQEVEKMYGRMPETVKNSKVLSDNAKKVLAGLLYSYAVSKPAKVTGVLCISNNVLRMAVGIKNEKMLSGLRELEMYDLIERKAGMARVEGQKSMASEYVIRFDALKKPIEELSFDDIFGDPKSSETPMGTAITISNTITNSNTISNIISNTSSNSKSDNIKYIDNNIKDNSTNIIEKPTNLKELSDYIKEKTLKLSKDCSTIEEYQVLQNQIIHEIEEEYGHIPSSRNCIYSVKDYFKKKEKNRGSTGLNGVVIIENSI